MPRLVNTLAGERGRARARRLPPPLQRPRRARRRVVRQPPAGERPARDLDPHRPGAPARHPESPRPAARAARRRAALHGRGGGRVPQPPPRPRAADRGRRPARRPHRGLARRHLPRRALARRHEDKHALVAAFDGTSAHVVDFLAGEVLAAHSPELQRFMLRTSVLERLCAPLCDAVLDEPGSADARRARAHEPVPARARRPPPLVPLPPPVRPAPESRALQARAGAGRDAAPARIRVASRYGRPTRRSTTRSPQGVQRGLGADRADVGALRQRRPDRVGQRVARPRPDDGDQALLLARAWVSALRGREADMRAAAPRRARSATSTTARCRTASSRSSPACSVLEATFGWGDVRRSSPTAALGASSSRLTRRGGP